MTSSSTRRLTSIESHLTPTRVGYADVTEELEGVPCHITGEVPKWISGRVYRQAGGAFISEKSTLLDALGHVVMWEVKEGVVKFTNKFLDTGAYRVLKETGVKSWTGTVKNEEKVEKKEDEAIRRKAVSVGNPNVNFWVFDGSKIAASSEFPQGECILLDPVTLKSLKTVKPLPGSNPMDPKTGFTFTTPAHFIKNPEAPSDYHLAMYLRIKDLKGNAEAGYKLFKGREINTQYNCVETVKRVEFNWGDKENVAAPEQDLLGYMHAVGESERHLVGLVPSKKLRFERLGDKKLGFFEFFTMGEGCVEFLVFSKLDGKYVGRVLCEGVVGMMFHVACCYDDGGDVGVVKIVTTFSSSDAFDKKTKKPSNESSGLMEFTLSLSNLTATSRLLTKTIFEFPTVNPYYLQKTPTYIYGVGLPTTFTKKPELGHFSVFRLDTTTGTHLEWSPPPGFIGSEPVFAPGASKSELDGMLLIPSINISEGWSALLCVDPSTMQTTAVVRNPIMVNFGLHNLFVPDVQCHPLKC